MAELMQEGFASLKRELDNWEERQDVDLMVASYPADVLLAALGSSKFDDEECGVIRSALLVKLYDIERRRSTGEARTKEAQLIRTWMADVFPDAKVPDAYPYGYISESLNTEKAAGGRTGFWSRLSAIFGSRQ